ncbi:MAG TPA: nuclear transport factor 2 family protein [Aliidongia sp.]|nr:nuclear transport factor 2 family protein [Aliidongia sp.]
MPSTERIKGLIALVEQGKFIEALEQFYHAEASMQENGEPPRRGVEALIAHERGVMERVKIVGARQAGPVFVSGDEAVLNWVFEIARPDGTIVRLDELARQRWQGDRIAEERFYYDPSQLSG